MKNVFGNSLTITLFGESHGPAVGAVLDGLAPGIKIDEEYISAKMDQRRPVGKISTPRKETDKPEFVSGVFNGYTTGTPLCVTIKNENTRSADYESISRLARPSHADLTARYKYGGFEDYRGGGHFSGRITAALVAAGSIVRKALEEKGILIGTHIRWLPVSPLCSSSVQFSSVAQSCPTLCNPMNCSTPGLPVHHQLPEFTQNSRLSSR